MHVILRPECIHDRLHKSFVVHMVIPLSQVAHGRAYGRDSAGLHCVLHHYSSVKWRKHSVSTDTRTFPDLSSSPSVSSFVEMSIVPW